MFIRTRTLAVLGLLTFSPALLLAAQTTPFECPTSIPRSALHVVNTEPGWVPFVASPLYLHAAAPMYGPPELRGDLAEFKERHGKDQWSYTYTFEGTYPEGKWLQCTYGEFNQVALSRRMPDEIKECTFIYRKGAKAGQNDIKIQCN